MIEFKRGDLPSELNEVSAIIFNTGETRGSRKNVIFELCVKGEDKVHYISAINDRLEPLQYPFIYPSGEAAWGPYSPNARDAEGNQISLTNWLRILQRSQVFFLCRVSFVCLIC